MKKLYMAMLLSLGGVAANAAENMVLASDQVIQYNSACDSDLGCYGAIDNYDRVSGTGGEIYTIGNDDQGQSINIVSTTYSFDPKSGLASKKYLSKEKNNYTRNGTLLDYTKWVSSDSEGDSDLAKLQNVLHKSYDYDVYGRESLQKLTLQTPSSSQGESVTLIAEEMYDDWNDEKVILTNLKPDEKSKTVYSTRHVKYDVLGRLVGQKYQFKGHEFTSKTEYNDIDQPIRSLDFNGNISENQYNNHGLLVLTQTKLAHESNQFNSPDRIVTTNTYDGFNRLRVNAIKNGVFNGQVNYSFDAAGLQTQILPQGDYETLIGDAKKQIENLNKLQYDNYGNIHQYTDFAGVTYLPTLTPQGDIGSIKISGGGIQGDISIQRYGYGEDVPVGSKGSISKVETTIYLNGQKQTQTKAYTYDALGQIKRMHTTSVVDGKTVEDTTVDYTYDGNQQTSKVVYSSNLDSSDDLNLNKTVLYSYDALNRLLSSKSEFSDGSQIIEQYEYTLSGSVQKYTLKRVSPSQATSIFTQNFTYEDGVLISVLNDLNGDKSTYTFEYDNNGNIITELTDDFTNYYTYNSLSQMIHFVQVDGHGKTIKDVDYGYYPSGNRAYKYSGDSLIGFMYDFNGSLRNDVLVKGDFQTKTNLKVEAISSFLPFSRYIQGVDGKSELELITKAQNNALQRIGVTTSGKDTGTQTNSQTYNILPYGQIMDMNAVDHQLNGAKDDPLGYYQNPLVYADGYHDAESGLEYMKARYYSPFLKQFMAQDSYNLINRYSYANGNPIANLDPSGHMPAWAKIGIGVLGVVAIVVTDGAMGKKAAAQGAAEVAAEITGEAAIDAGEAMSIAENASVIVEGEEIANMSELSFAGEAGGAGGAGVAQDGVLGAQEGLGGEGVVAGQQAGQQAGLQGLHAEVEAGQVGKVSPAFWRKSSFFAANFAKNEAIMFGVGAAQTGTLQGGLDAAGLSNHGQGIVTNLIGTGVWVGFNTSGALDRALSRGFLNKQVPFFGWEYKRLPVFIVEGLASNAASQAVTMAYTGDTSFDWISFGASSVLGIFWDGATESKWLAGKPYAQSIGHTAWGALLNYGMSAATTGQTDPSAEDINSYVNNSMTFGMYFSVIPGQW